MKEYLGMTFQNSPKLFKKEMIVVDTRWVKEIGLMGPKK